MRVVAVDPAPGKESTVFDGEEFCDLAPAELRHFLNELSSAETDTLVCWDSPLTGPADPSSAGDCRGDFTQRPIDSFFSRKETGFKTPKGISVLPYGGCPHWTISRSLIGLPRMGPFDHCYDGLPFHLVPGPESERGGRACIIEIHPAVAAWLWCRREKRGRAQWVYKGSRGSKASRETLRQEMWSIILRKTQFRWTLPDPTNDDQFDAAVGYVLGSLYADEMTRGQVTVLGSRETGSFLLPAVPRLTQKWDRWIRSSPR